MVFLFGIGIVSVEGGLNKDLTVKVKTILYKSVKAMSMMRVRDETSQQVS